LLTASTSRAVRSNVHPRPLGARETRRGLLLINLGAPDGHDAKSIRRFLTQRLSDPCVLTFPRHWRWLRRLVAGSMARRMARRSAPAYRRIWTDHGSPLKTVREDQVAAIRKQLGDDWFVIGAVRYGEPKIADALRQIVAAGVTDLVVIPMMPHFAASITGTTLDRLYQGVSRSGLGLNIEVCSNWHDDAGYIEAQALLIGGQIAQHELTPDDTVLLYATRSTPLAHVNGGDPYETQVRRSAELVNARLGWPSDRTRLSFHSELRLPAWLTPTTSQTLAELAARGEKTVLVCPLGFTADCVETLEQIDSAGARQLEHEGGRLLQCPSLNTFEPFVKAVSVIARRGSHPFSDQCAVPLLRGIDETFDLKGAIEKLIMVGVCAAGRITSADEPGIGHLSRHQFRRIKRPQSGALELLRAVHSEGHYAESWLWNTCNRFEFYGLRHSDDGPVASNHCVEDVARCMFSDAVDVPDANVLHGIDAWRHLLQTAAGLNSSLPGDTDVIEQLGAAYRLARHAGVAAAMVEQLLAEIRQIVGQVRTRTPWGRFGTGYCHAALNELAATVRPPWSECKCVVIGASTTSWSILRTLVDRFGVPQEQLTVVYRGGGRHRMVKMLRQASGRGRRVLVRQYAERATIDAIAGADVVFFGVDQAEPIVRARQLADLRRDVSGPLTIVDFNTFGSTDRIKGIDGVRLIDSRQIEAHVDRFAERIIANHEFHSAATAAREAIAAHVENIVQSGQRSRHRPTQTTRHSEPAALRPAATLGTDA